MKNKTDKRESAKIPLKLYKYYSLKNKYVIKNLGNDFIWFSNPNNFNDPYDCLMKIIYEGFANDVFNKAMNKSAVSSVDFLRKIMPNSKDITEENFHRYSQFFENTRLFKKCYDKEASKLDDNTFKKMYNDEIFIFCMSECKDDILMWSHYANNHMGICVEYETDKFPQNLKERLCQVKYVSEYTQRKYDFTDPDNRELIKAITVKCDKWNYEHEWRIITNRKQLSNTKSNLSSFIKPSAIILGTKTSSKDIESIAKLIKNKEIALYKMELANDKYKLEPKKYDI